MIISHYGTRADQSGSQNARLSVSDVRARMHQLKTQTDDMLRLQCERLQRLSIERERGVV